MTAVPPSWTVVDGLSATVSGGGPEIEQACTPASGVHPSGWGFDWAVVDVVLPRYLLRVKGGSFYQYEH